MWQQVVSKCVQQVVSKCEMSVTVAHPHLLTKDLASDSWRNGGGTYQAPVWTVKLRDLDGTRRTAKYSFDDEGTFRNVETGMQYHREYPRLAPFHELAKFVRTNAGAYEVYDEVNMEYIIVKDMFSERHFIELAESVDHMFSEHVFDALGESVQQEFAQPFALSELKRVNKYPGMSYRAETGEWMTSELLRQLVRHNGAVPKKGDDRKVLVIVLGSRLVPGMWSRSVMLTQPKGLLSGTARPYIDMVTGSGEYAGSYAGVVVLNPNSELNTSLNPNSEGLASEIEYTRNALQKLVLPLRRKIDLLAHSNGGRLVVGALLKDAPDGKENGFGALQTLTNKVAFTDSYHSSLQHLVTVTESVKSLLAVRSRNWVPSDKKLGQDVTDKYMTLGYVAFPKDIQPVRCVSAGGEEGLPHDKKLGHPLTNYAARNDLMKWLNEVGAAEAGDADGRSKDEEDAPLRETHDG